VHNVLHGLEGQSLREKSAAATAASHPRLHETNTPKKICPKGKTLLYLEPVQNLFMIIPISAMTAI
jgi:hypothetical protein